MGVGRIFASGWASGFFGVDFFGSSQKDFSRMGQKWLNFIYLLETKMRTFFC